MKVLVYLYAYPPFRYTGGELMTADLLEALVQRGHSVHVYADHLAGTTDEYVRNGVWVRSSAYLYADVAKAYDVFITHPEIRTGAIQYTKGLPYIGIVHNTVPGTLRSLDRQAPHLTVVNSEFTRQHVPEVAHRTGKGVVVLNPPVLIDGGDVVAPVAERHRYVTAINLSHEKGGAVVRYLADTFPKERFRGVIGGHGEQITDMPDNVTITPPTDDMRPIYQTAKVLVFPTKRESYGKVAAEAMQFGVPLIVSDLPALHEVCDDAAIYVDPSDYAGWVTALTRMLTPDVYAEYVHRSNDRAGELRARSLDDLDRWEALVKEVAGHAL